MPAQAPIGSARGERDGPRRARALARTCSVQSTSPMSTLLESAISAPSSSHAGFIALQWPHQGAKNFTKALLPPDSASSSKFPSSSTVTAAARGAAHASASAHTAAHASARERARAAIAAVAEASSSFAYAAPRARCGQHPPRAANPAEAHAPRRCRSDRDAAATRRTER